MHTFRSLKKNLPILLSIIVLFASAIATSSAGSIDNEQTNFGSACSGTNNGIDWDTIFQCNGSTWQRSALFLGATSDSCNSTHAGMLQWNGSIFQGCNSSSWTTITGATGGAGSTSATTTSYTSPGSYSWTPAAGNNVARVFCMGGGGGGAGGAGTAGSYSQTYNYGGGAAYYAIGIFSISALTTPVTITIGAGGAGGAANANGSAGGTTTFGSYLSATGGAGGQETTLVYAGAAPAGTLYSGKGADSSPVYGYASLGGNSFFALGAKNSTGTGNGPNGNSTGNGLYYAGGGGGPGGANYNSGVPGNGGVGGYGSGGGGGANSNNTSNPPGAGGSGGGGACVVTEW